MLRVSQVIAAKILLQKKTDRGGVSTHLHWALDIDLVHWVTRLATIVPLEIDKQTLGFLFDRVHGLDMLLPATLRGGPGCSLGSGSGTSACLRDRRAAGRSTLTTLATFGFTGRAGRSGRLGATARSSGLLLVDRLAANAAVVLVEDFGSALPAIGKYSAH